MAARWRLRRPGLLPILHRSPGITPSASQQGKYPMRPLQPHPSWYRRFWYAEQSLLGKLVDRVLMFAIAMLALLAGITFLDH
jgi:quinol-cytochrome oxidoreductase complex cytochrome b subunit